MTAVPLHRARARGFTLLELMMTVAIIALLASVAIPEFGRLMARTKTAERVLMLQRLRHAIQDYYMRNGSLPSGTSGNFNPPLPAGSQKRSWDFTMAGWKDVVAPGDLEGALYYSYFFLAVDVGGSPLLFLWARGDLDADGIPSDKFMWYQRIDGLYQTLSEWPPAGAEDTTSF